MLGTYLVACNFAELASGEWLLGPAACASKPRKWLLEGNFGHHGRKYGRNADVDAASRAGLRSLAVPQDAA
jgi:hypothetical protein